MARFTNQAQLAYNNAVTSSNIAVGEILEVLSANKMAVRGSYEPGERITYIVSILNTGGAAFPGMTVSDNLGAYMLQGKTIRPLTYVENTAHYYVNGVRQNDPAVESGPALSITGIGIPAGGNAVLVYQAQVNRYAPLAEGAQIESETTISGSGVTPVSVKAVVTAESQPLLTITKAVSPVPVVENGVLTYTFLLQNNGSAAAEARTAAVVTDHFEPALSALSVSFNGTLWSEHTHYTYDAHSGEFATIAGQITVPAATYAQDSLTGIWQTTPGVSTLTVSGTV